MMAEVNAKQQMPALKLALIFLRMIGGYSKRRNILGYFTVISVFGIVSFMTSDLILNFTGIESLRRIIFLPSFFVGSMKGLFMIKNNKQLIATVDDIPNFWKPNKFDAETEKKAQKVIRYITIICASYFISGIAISGAIISMPFLDFEAKTLPYSDFAFCDLQSLSCWIPMYIWQSYGLMFQLAPIVLGFDCLYISSVGYVIVGCKLLKEGLQKLNTDNLKMRRYILKEVVDQHDFIMNFLNGMNDMYTAIMLLQFWCSLWSMILFLYMIVADGLPPKAADVSYFGSIYMILVGQIFIYSTGGAIIEERVRSVATDMFNVNWYGKNRTSLRKDLAFMIYRAQRTKILNAGKMSDLNYTLFIATVKNSLSVVTLIFQMANQETTHHQHRVEF